MYNKNELLKELAKENKISFDISQEDKIAIAVLNALLFEMEKADIEKMLSLKNPFKMQLFILECLCPQLSIPDNDNVEERAQEMKHILQAVTVGGTEPQQEIKYEEQLEGVQKTLESVTQILKDNKKRLDSSKEMLQTQLEETSKNIKDFLVEEIAKLLPVTEEPEEGETSKEIIQNEDIPKETSSPKEYLHKLLFEQASAFSAAQIRVLRELHTLDLPIEAVKAIAKAENDVTKMQEMMQFFATKKGE